MQPIGAITLESLGAEPTTPTQVLHRVRDTHHALARTLAAGMTAVEASRITGYSPARIASLKSDPSFQELIEHYRGQVQAEFIDTHTKLAALASDAVQELQARLDETPQEFSVNQLLEVVKTTADRSGNGPTKTLNQRTLIVDARTISEIKQRSRSANILSLADLDAEGPSVPVSPREAGVHPELPAPQGDES